MEWWLIGLLMFCSLFILLTLGVPVGFALISIAIFSGFFIWGTRGWLTLAANSFSSINNYLLLAAPLFILMGIFVEVSGLGADAFKAIENWLGSLRGGLAIATVAAATIFGAATGFSGIASSAFGPIALPEMANRKYNPGLALGAMGGGSALAVLIPPSVPLLMYGFLSGTSVAKLFYAGLIPGILGALFFMVYISIRVRINPSLAPASSPVTWREKIINTWRILPLFILIFIILGSLWGGFATPTEAASLGGFGAFVIVLCYRRLKYAILKQVLLRTALITAMVFTIIIGAFAFTQILSYSGFVTNVSTLMGNLPVPPWMILALMMLTNLFMGCFFDTLAILFLTIPIYLPIVSHLGFDPIWFGVLIVINSEIGTLTPPVGIALYILKGVAPSEWSFTTAILGVAPYWFLYLFLLIIVALIPPLALWLPNFMLP